MTTTTHQVIQGAESFYIKGNDIGILLTHGFVGTPQSVRFLGNEFAKRGFTVLAPRLKGHGTDYSELEETTYRDWLAELEEAYYKLEKACSHVFIIGQSMGGALALLLTKNIKPSGVVTINAAFSVPEYEVYKNEQVIKYVEEGQPDIKDKSVTEITYPFVPVQAIKQLLEVINHSKENLSNVTCPLLLFKSLEDHVVPAASTDYVFNHVSSKEKEMVELKNSYHVASMDYDKLTIVDQTEAFIRNITAKSVRGYKVS